MFEQYQLTDHLRHNTCMKVIC